MESVDSAEYVELMEDGSVMEDDAISIISSMVSSRSVMRMTEAFMDELCVSVENDLLGKDENYKDVIRDYRKYKQSRRHTSSVYDADEEETILSSSFGTCSDDDDMDSLRLDQYEGIRTKTILQALLLGALPHRKKISKSESKAKKEQNTKVDDVSLVDVEPMYNSGLNANLDSVEVGSLKEDSNSKDALKSPDGASPTESSVASTENATDDSSSNSVATEATKNLMVFNEVFPAEERQELPELKPRNELFSILDTASHYTDYTINMASTEVLSNHLKQRRAIYLWSISLLQQKLQEQQGGAKTNSEEIRTLIHPTHKPQTIQEYDQTIVRALTLSMSHDSVETTQDSSFEFVETKPFLSKFGHSLITKKDQAKKLLQKNTKLAIATLQLRKKVERSAGDSDVQVQKHQSRDWHQLQHKWKKKVVKTTQKSLHLLRKEAVIDAIYLAMQLKKRALKLHATLSVLNFASNKQLSKSIATDLGSLEADSASSREEEDSIAYREESVEVVEPLTTDNPKRVRHLQRIVNSKIISKFKKANKWKVPESFNMSFSSRQGSSPDIDSTGEEIIMFCLDSSEASEAIEEEAGGFEVTV
jgi:hypothetical protein